MRLYHSIFLTGLLCTAGSAIGEQRTIYRYDALGRLTELDDRASSGAGHSAAYSLDRAGNRTVALTAKVLRNNCVPGGTGFDPGTGVVSSNNDYRLTFQFDGNLVVYNANGRATWSSGTMGSGGNGLAMQTDGNLVIYANGNAVWSSGTWGNPGAFLCMQMDGNLVIYNSAGNPLWHRWAV